MSRKSNSDSCPGEKTDFNLNTFKHVINKMQLFLFTLVTTTAKAIRKYFMKIKHECQRANSEYRITNNE